MAQEKLIEAALQTVTRKLAADVNTPYVPVMATANEGEVKVADSQNAAADGILCQTGKAGEQVPIVIAGVVPVKVNAAVDRGAELITSSTGMCFASPLTSGTVYNIVGRSLTKATAANEFVSVQVAPRKLSIKA